MEDGLNIGVDGDIIIFDEISCKVLYLNYMKTLEELASELNSPFGNFEDIQKMCSINNAGHSGVFDKMCVDVGIDDEDKTVIITNADYIASCILDIMLNGVEFKKDFLVNSFFMKNLDTDIKISLIITAINLSFGVLFIETTIEEI
jgi:hypothetical protein